MGYEPYGPEWVKELMQFKKPELIARLKKALLSKVKERERGIGLIDGIAKIMRELKFDINLPFDAISQSDQDYAERIYEKLKNLLSNNIPLPSPPQSERKA